MVTIERAERDVQIAWEAARKVAEAQSELALVEQQLWSALLALGRALIVLFLTRAASRPRSADYAHEGVRYVLDTSTRRSSQIGTRFGKVPFRRPVGRPLGGRTRRMDLPVDRELGLCSGFSLGTVTALVRLCTLLAFGTARKVFSESHEWSPSPRATLRMIDALGGQARAFLEQAAPPEDDGEVLVIQVDGRGAPMINATEADRRRRPRRKKETGTGRHRRRQRRREHKRPRRKKGDKSKNAKVAIVGVLYTLRRTRTGMEGPIGKRMVATFEGHEALFRWLRAEADKRGYGHKRTLFLADGSDHIWRNQEKYFPKAEVCLDWYHVTEKLWSAGECLHSEGSAELNAWVSQQTARLRRGQTRDVTRELIDALDSLPKTGPGNAGRRKRLSNVLDYLMEHLHRLRYRQLRRDDLDIGTGAVEGAVRNLVGLRLDGPGMRWGRDRAEMVLHLRCIVLNDQWADFCAYLACRSVKLAPRPLPVRTHDAKPQQSREAA